MVVRAFIGDGLMSDRAKQKQLVLDYGVEKLR